MKKLWSNPRGIELSNAGNAYWFGREERYMLDKTELKAVADAIYKDLGLGWLPYPENIPPLAEYYFITMVNISNEPSTFYAKYSFSINAWLSPFGGLMDDEFYKTVAFMKIPTPYQPN